MRSCKGQYSLEVPEDAESVDAVFIIKRQMKYQIKFDESYCIVDRRAFVVLFHPKFLFMNIFHCWKIILLRRLIQLIKGYFNCLFCNYFKIFV